jgi:phosphotransferase system enzyme I (PtsI)
LRFPAVIGLHRVLDQIENGEDVLLDGIRADDCQPEFPDALRIREHESRRRLMETELTQLRETVSTTRDGRHVTLSRISNRRKMSGRCWRAEQKA